MVQIDNEGRIIGFQEKPAEPQPMPNDPGKLGVHGHLCFHRPHYVRTALPGRDPPESDHDFGRNIIPGMIGTSQRFHAPFPRQKPQGDSYSRNVGTLDAYYQANMDLIEVDPVLNLYDRVWPIRTYQPQLPPPKFVFSDAAATRPPRRGPRQHGLPRLHHLAAATCAAAFFPRNVRINSFAVVEDSILFSSVDVGRHCRIRRAIIDKDVKIPPGP